MAEGGRRPNSTEGRQLLRDLPAAVAATLGVLAIAAYPLGVAAYWVQIWREYTHDATTAIYAASLLPAPVAAGRTMPELLSAFLIVGGVAGAAGNAFVNRTSLPEDAARKWPVTLDTLMSALGVVTTAVLVPVVGLFTLDSPADVFFYVCALVIAAVGGGFATWMAFSAVSTAADEGHGFRAFVPSVIVLGMVIIFAAILLIPLHSPALVTVRFGDGPDGKAKLLTHSQGYWYVIKDGKRSVTAVPDKAIGTATITRP